MAPELLLRKRPSIASDLYAFGLIIDEMVTVKRAFSSTSLQALYYEKLWEQPSPPSSRSIDLPKHWERTILRCLNPDPASRFSVVQDVVNALEKPELTLS